MRALVVDDSKPSRSIVSRVLRELSFECAEAANGAEALDVLATTARPDVVTINWHMPVMDGLELIRRLRGPALGPAWGPACAWRAAARWPRR